MPVENHHSEVSSHVTKPESVASDVTTSSGSLRQQSFDDSTTAGSTFPSDVVENGSSRDINRSPLNDTLLDTSQISETGSPLGNTLDDVSSLRTVDDGSLSPVQNDDQIAIENEDGEGHADALAADPESIKEPISVNGDVSETEEVANDGWIDVIGSGDLMKKVLRKGNGLESRPQRGDVVTINIEGKLEDGRAVDVGRGVSVTVGDAEVIQGLDLAIPLMELNEVAEIVVKPRLAYGKLGKDPDIPPNATVSYTIEVLSVEDEPNSQSLTFSLRTEIGNRKRERGNFWFSRGEYSCALQCYRKALEFLDDETPAVQTEYSDDLKELLENRIKVYNNMAAAQLKIGAFDAALKSVSNVLNVQPKNVKAIFRKGKILESLGQTEEAIDTLKEAIQLEPEAKIIHQELSKLIVKQKSEVKSEREMYRRMLGQDKRPTTKEHSKRKAASCFIKWGAVAGGLTIALLSVVAYKHFHGAAGGVV